MAWLWRDSHLPVPAPFLVTREENDSPVPLLFPYIVYYTVQYRVSVSHSPSSPFNIHSTTLDKTLSTCSEREKAEAQIYLYLTHYSRNVDGREEWVYLNGQLFHFPLFSSETQGRDSALLLLHARYIVFFLAWREQSDSLLTNFVVWT